MIQPINQLFKFLKEKNLVTIIFKGSHDYILEGNLIGFDEFMNLVIENTIEKKDNLIVRNLGHVLIKGDSILTISSIYL